MIRCEDRGCRADRGAALSRELKEEVRHMAGDEDTQVYMVIVNDEEQYSLWPKFKETPLGWKAAGKTGSKDECTDYIKEVWTDMRPLSLRRTMEAAEGNA